MKGDKKGGDNLEDPSVTKEDFIKILSRDLNDDKKK